MTPEDAARIDADQRRVNTEALLKSAAELGPTISKALAERSARRSIERIDAYILRKEQPAHPVPLIRKQLPPSAFPLDALGPTLGPAAAAIAEIVQVPPALAGNSV